MALPLPRTVADVGPGGPLVTAMGGINALVNNMHNTRYNKVKADWANTTIPAQAYSQLAYANAVSPQIFAKLLGDKGALANMSDEQKNALLKAIEASGYRATAGLNNLNQMPGQGGQQGQTPAPGMGRDSINRESHSVWDALKDIIVGNKKNRNAINQPPQQYNNSGNPNVSAQGPGRIDSGSPFVGQQGNRPTNQQQQNDGIDHGLDQKMLEWQQSPQGQRDDAVLPSEEALRSGSWKNEPSMEIDMVGGQPAPKKKTYLQNTADYLGALEQGKQSGKNRADALKDIGNLQFALSGSGAAQDELIKIIQNPVWQHARDTFPGFQKEQLSVLKVTGSPEFRKLAGEYTSAGQAMVASQVAGMGSKHLVREYDLAQKQKINDSDTIESAEGKLTNAKNLHDIAVQKNNIIKNLLKQGVDEADAVEIANEKVDVSAIRRATDKLLERKISVTNNKTGETRLMSVREAQELGVPNV